MTLDLSPTELVETYRKERRRVRDMMMGVVEFLNMAPEQED